MGFYPTVIVIAPNKEIVARDIWPFNYQIAKSELQTHGVSTSACPIPAQVNELSSISNIKLTPNPASFASSLEFTLNEANFCKIQLIDITGQNIRNILSENRSPGFNRVEFSISDISDGTYIVKIQTDNSIPQIEKLVIAKYSHFTFFFFAV